ncbi:hypothetical protein HT576_12010 [Haloterrigena sp. SYSU A121-1]|uniref:DUF8173 domain-containing protein n=1 Tax=Haloterrigena gelatinilytica TaxID=2741724 RepID=A0A8J8GM82_9EURY|nr:hypothetical protein [Haloterrigena gelatinilytica]NUB91740.1 hypothetical protein [Haloterrigena gelatinilytica]
MIDFVQSVTVAVSIAQANPNPGVDVDVGAPVGLVGGAVGAFLTTLVVGAILVAIAPAYTERMMAAVLEDPFGAFLYGILSLLALGLLTFLLVITIVGIFVAIPLVLVAYLVWAVGAAVGYLAIAERLVGRDDGWLTPLLVAAAINGALALTGIGGLISLCVGAAGFGIVLRDALA